MNPGTRLTFEWRDAQIEDWNSRPPTVSDVVDWLESEGVGELVVVRQDRLGETVVHMAGNPLADAAANLKTGSYLVIRVEDGET